MMASADNKPSTVEKITNIPMQLVGMTAKWVNVAQMSAVGIVCGILVYLVTWYMPSQEKINREERNRLLERFDKTLTEQREYDDKRYERYSQKLEAGFKDLRARVGPKVEPPKDMQ